MVFFCLFDVTRNLPRNLKRNNSRLMLIILIRFGCELAHLTQNRLEAKSAVFGLGLRLISLDGGGGSLGMSPRYCHRSRNSHSGLCPEKQARQLCHFRISKCEART